MKWIDVKDRLPDDGVDCLFFSDTIELGYINGGTVWIAYDQDGFTNLSDITHWMPLPEPPK